MNGSAFTSAFCSAVYLIMLWSQFYSFGVHERDQETWPLYSKRKRCSCYLSSCIQLEPRPLRCNKTQLLYWNDSHLMSIQTLGIQKLLQKNKKTCFTTLRLKNDNRICRLLILSLIIYSEINSTTRGNYMNIAVQECSSFIVWLGIRVLTLKWKKVKHFIIRCRWYSSEGFCKTVQICISVLLWS